MLMTLFQVLWSRQVIYCKEKKSISVVTQVQYLDTLPSVFLSLGWYLPLWKQYICLLDRSDMEATPCQGNFNNHKIKIHPDIWFVLSNHHKTFLLLLEWESFKNVKKKKQKKSYNLGYSKISYQNYDLNSSPGNFIFNL